VDALQSFIKKTYSTDQIVLWGRSMGAASILMSQGARVCVLDSSFKSIENVSRDIVRAAAPGCVPGCLLGCLFKCLFCCVNKYVESYVSVGLDKLSPEEHVAKMDPARALIFLSGCHDTFVLKENSIDLYRLHKGPKELIIFEGTHNSHRTSSTYSRVFEHVIYYL
jgi:hypothetical protein